MAPTQILPQPDLYDLRQRAEAADVLADRALDICLTHPTEVNVRIATERDRDALRAWEMLRYAERAARAQEVAA